MVLKIDPIRNGSLHSPAGFISVYTNCCGRLTSGVSSRYARSRCGLRGSPAYATPMFSVFCINSNVGLKKTRKSAISGEMKIEKWVKKFPSDVICFKGVVSPIIRSAPKTFSTLSVMFHLLFSRLKTCSTVCQFISFAH